MTFFSVQSTCRVINPNICTNTRYWFRYWCIPDQNPTNYFISFISWASCWSSITFNTLLEIERVAKHYLKEEHSSFIRQFFLSSYGLGRSTKLLVKANNCHWALWEPLCRHLVCKLAFAPSAPGGPGGPAVPGGPCNDTVRASVSVRADDLYGGSGANDADGASSLVTPPETDGGKVSHLNSGSSGVHAQLGTHLGGRSSECL